MHPRFLAIGSSVLFGFLVSEATKVAVAHPADPDCEPGQGEYDFEGLVNHELYDGLDRYRVVDRPTLCGGDDHWRGEDSVSRRPIEWKGYPWCFAGLGDPAGTLDWLNHPNPHDLHSSYCQAWDGRGSADLLQPINYRFSSSSQEDYSSSETYFGLRLHTFERFAVYLGLCHRLTPEGSPSGIGSETECTDDFQGRAAVFVSHWAIVADRVWTVDARSKGPDGILAEVQRTADRLEGCLREGGGIPELDEEFYVLCSGPHVIATPRLP